MRRVGLFASMAIALMLAGEATAASIRSTTDEVDGKPFKFIYVEGPIQLGDEQRFADEALNAKSAVVFFSSPGGNLFAGIEIGKIIRIKSFMTIVPDGYNCVSACALAWLGGVPRFMAPGQTVGFHAAFDQDGPSSAGNAMVGSYLNDLGLPVSAIVYLTARQAIEWLTFEDAKRLGISVEKWEEPKQASNETVMEPTPRSSITDQDSLFDIYQDTDLNGGDYAQYKPRTFGWCQQKCLNDNRCIGFTYILDKDWCWLKSHAWDSSRKADNLISGIKTTHR